MRKLRPRIHRGVQNGKQENPTSRRNAQPLQQGLALTMQNILTARENLIQATRTTQDDELLTILEAALCSVNDALAVAGLSSRPDTHELEGMAPHLVWIAAGLQFSWDEQHHTQIIHPDTGRTVHTLTTRYATRSSAHEAIKAWINGRKN